MLIIAQVVIERPRSEDEAKIVQELLSQRINSNYEKSVQVGPMEVPLVPVPVRKV